MKFKKDLHFVEMRIILAIFSDRFEAFTSLKPFFDAHPEYLKHKENINTHLSRRKIDFVCDGLILKRLNVQKAKK